MANIVCNIGCHLNIKKKDFIRAMLEAEEKIGFRTFQFFTKNPRQFRMEELDDGKAAKVRQIVQERHYRIFSHASYLLNMSNPEKWDEKVENGICELVNIHKLGGVGTVFHVGKHLKLSVEEGLDLMERYIVAVLEGLYRRYPDHQVSYILETSAGQGSELLRKVDDLMAFFHRFTGEKYRENAAVWGRLKLCMDTAHLFAAGHRIGADLSHQIDWTHVACVHLNDSLSIFHSCVDRHANIGKGFIGDSIGPFLQISLPTGIPHIFETPHDDDNIFETHQEEINYIQNLLKTS